jgi:hypothetical protein
MTRWGYTASAGRVRCRGYNCRDGGHGTSMPG